MRNTLPTRGHRLSAVAAAVAAAGVVAGCAAGPGGEPSAETAVEPAAAPADQDLPVTELPVTQRDPAGQCPYLDAQWVAEANGQRVTGVGVDQRFDTPACQFWSYPEDPMLTVLVRHMGSAEDAMAVVDWAAPVEHTEPADDPEGWNGGRHGGGAVPGREGAVYSVAKGPVAVTVFSNQNESVKAQVVAEQVIATLGL
ncbi:DUF2020 domain-containing protein [Corynebacterium qintianiae]|uniref:DUF2020 domain-containing protein n=1 Tax=Corynebacterium qintianiae TaxID=2709392 RepID=UPI0013ECBFB1|nr:DUF2020 domain-containing protein [Corynebacterium qintianiae]